MTLKKELLLSLLILAVFLMPTCMSIGAVAKELDEATLPKSPFVNVEIKSISYGKVYGTEMVKNGSEVSISVVLTNFSKEIEGDKSKLFFHSDLEDPVWGISIDGTPEECKSPFTIDHRKVTEARITLAGRAPEVNKRKENVTILNITQEIKETYLVIDVKRDVTSEIIEDALNAWHKAKEETESANLTIANATKRGVDVSEARRAFELANEYLNNSRDFYNGGTPEKALKEAGKALEYAGDAKKLAEGAKTTRTIRDYSVLAAAVVIAIVVFVFLIRHRRRKRGIY